MLDIRRENRSAVLRLLHERGELSRKQLAIQIGLTPAAVTKIVNEMIAEGVISEGRELHGNGAGRREIMLHLNAQAFCTLGILLDLKYATVSGIWLDGSIIFSERIPVNRRLSADEMVDALSGRLMELVKKHSLRREKILGLGVAIRGIVSPDGRRSVNSFGIFKEQDYPIAQRFEEQTGLKCWLLNNVRALFLAQIFMEKDRYLSSQFFLRCEQGIGAALFINGKLWYGSSGQCSEIGHIPVVRRGGKPCNCGKSGCLETIASPIAIREDALEILSPERTPVLWRMCKDKSTDEVDINDVLNAASSGDEEIAEIVDKAVLALCNALKNLIYIVDPEKIILYGRLFENSYYLSKMMAEMRENMGMSYNVIIEKSRYNLCLEDRAGGMVALDHFLSNGAVDD